MRGESTRWRLGYRRALDGLRGIAVLLVMAAHAEIPGFKGGGGVGVTMFFVLSGFLITSLLMEEQRHAGRIDLRAFYRRRAVRLLPALGALIIALVALGWATPGDAERAAFYVSNWVQASGTDLRYLSHTWSLAVEEQFYLVWPAVFMLLGRRPRTLLIVAFGGAGLSILVRMSLWTGPAASPRVYFGSDTRGDAILLGCALGLLLAGGYRIVVSRKAAVVAGVVLAVVTAVFTSQAFFYRWGLALAAVSSVVIVARVAARPAGPSALLERPALVRVGRLSYALYLWHFPLMTWASPERVPSTPARLLFTFGLSYLLAVASFDLIEMPLLRRFKTRRPSADGEVLDNPAGAIARPRPAGRNAVRGEHVAREPIVHSAHRPDWASVQGRNGLGVTLDRSGPGGPAGNQSIAGLPPRGGGATSRRSRG
jgi:peptidoglycan/LPS O-acetylase OafA/YrhL